MIECNWNKILNIKRWDWILLVGMTMSPMTNLRIWKIGPAEIMCLIWGIKFYNGRIKDSIILRFFIGFLSIMFVGTIIGTLLTPNETDLSGFITWIYFAVVSISLIEGLSQNTLEYNENLFIVFTRISCFLYASLCLYGTFVSKTIFGLELWYLDKRFSGGASNPHQVALMLSVLIMLSLRDIYKHGAVLINVLCIFGCAFALYKTDSSTAFLATGVGILALINCAIMQNKEYKKIVYIFEFISLVFIFIFFHEKLFNFAYDWIASDPNGVGRFEIFKSYSKTFWESPIFGLGPGVHALNGTSEYHNTYIEVMAATGIAGLLIFCLFSIRLIKITLDNDVFLLPCVLACYTFGMAGFGMRRLVYWISIVFVVLICDQKNQKNKSV